MLLIHFWISFPLLYLIIFFVYPGDGSIEFEPTSLSFGMVPIQDTTEGSQFLLDLLIAPQALARSTAAPKQRLLRQSRIAAL